MHTPSPAFGPLPTQGQKPSKLFSPTPSPTTDASTPPSPLPEEDQSQNSQSQIEHTPPQARSRRHHNLPPRLIQQAQHLSPVVRPRKRTIRHRNTQKLAQRAPTVLGLELEHLPLRNLPPHHGVVLGVRSIHLCPRLPPRLGAQPAHDDIPQNAQLREAGPGPQPAQRESPSTAAEIVQDNLPETSLPRIDRPLDQDDLCLGVRTNKLLSVEARHVSDGPLAPNQPVPVPSRPGEQGVHGVDVERQRPGRAQARRPEVGHVAPRGLAPGVVLSAVRDVERVVHGAEAERCEGRREGSRAGSGERRAYDAVARGEALLLFFHG